MRTASQRNKGVSHVYLGVAATLSDALGVPDTPERDRGDGSADRSDRDRGGSSQEKSAGLGSRASR